MSSRSRDHPRVCGEKFTEGSGLNDSLGSPPRVRGKVHDVFQVRNPVGITPRVCGEKSMIFMLSRFTVGSPPRVRGKV